MSSGWHVRCECDSSQWKYANVSHRQKHKYRHIMRVTLAAVWLQLSASRSLYLLSHTHLHPIRSLTCSVFFLTFFSSQASTDDLEQTSCILSIQLQHNTIHTLQTTMPCPSLSPSLCVFKVRDDMISSWYLSHNILLSTAVSVLSILYLPVSCSWLFFLWGEKGLWGREGWLRERERERVRQSKTVVGGVFFVTLQASKCSQVHSAPWERWRTLGTFVATGMWCTQCAHGNKVRL